MKRFVSLTLLIAVVLDALGRALVSELESWEQLLGIARDQLADSSTSLSSQLALLQWVLSIAISIGL